jgi:rhamnulokinase
LNLKQSELQHHAQGWAIMTEIINFLAIDLGASSGRVLVGGWDGEHINLEELHRFPNDPVIIQGHQHWDVLRLWREIKAGITCYARQYETALSGIGVDTWGVDFALLDAKGNLIGNPYHYRDARTDGMMELAFQRMPRQQIFEQTGNQFIKFNTLYQLLSMAYNNDPQLEIADTILMMPDLFHYWLTGEKATEFTIATTSQMYDIRKNSWAINLLTQLEIPQGLLPSVVSPGTILGQVPTTLMSEADLRQPASVVATGSHDTSNAIAAIPGLDDSSAYISSGTWSLMGVEMAEPVINDQVLALNFTNEGGVGDKINVLKILTGLWLLQESQLQWQREGNDYGWDELLALGEQAEPFQSLIDPDATEFLNPTDMPTAIRDFCQRTGQPEPSTVGAVVRCCLESLALNYRKALEDLETLTGKHLKTIRIVGGGSQNRLLSQYAADACQRLVVTGPVEATALGNVLLQAIATGHLPDIAAGRKAIAASFEQQHFEPGSKNAWDQAYGHFKNLKL